MAGDAVKRKPAVTAMGHGVTIDTANGALVNDATIVKADIHATSGAIRVINLVPLPRWGPRPFI